MATPTVASSSNTGFTAATTSVTLAKPTGLAVGNVLYAIVAQFLPAAINVWTLPSGWTVIRQRTVTSNGYVVAYKVADAADVAAANFVFSSDRSGVTGGIICRITGLVSGIELENSLLNVTSSPNNTVFSFSTSASPRSTNTLVVIANYASETAVASVAPSLSTYTSTPSLTWTEVQDIGYRSGANACAISVAYANHTASTQITQCGYTVSQNTSNAADNVLALFNGDVSATGSSTFLAAPPVLVTPVGTNSSSGSSSPTLNVAPLLHSPRAKSSSDVPLWTPEVKTAGSWTSQTK